MILKTNLKTVLLSLILLSSYAAADVPVVVSDTPTTHSLVSSVMGELGTSSVLMPASASPHDYAMRPSEASLLESADIIFWTSSELTPWLARAMRSLASDAQSIELMKAEDTLTLGFRRFVNYPGKAEREHSHENLSTVVIDPHGWLDPVNAQKWLKLIANKLSLLDPDNADTYSENAQKEITEIDMLMADIATQLNQLDKRTFIVFHDSYHYFEDRFNFHSTAAISLADSEHPNIKQLNTLRRILADYPGACVFAEPQFSDRLIKTITHGQDVNVGLLDPLGALQLPGASLYRAVVKQLADSLTGCLQ